MSRLKPALVYKEQLITAARKLRYTDEIFWYNGCICQGDLWIREEEDDGNIYQYAIMAEDDRPIGYISYRLDHFVSSAYNFGLIYLGDGRKSDRIYMALGLKEAIEDLLNMRPHRVEFRCVGGNPAEKHYRKIIKLMQHRRDIDVVMNDFILHDSTRDKYGKWHNDILFELIIS